MLTGDKAHERGSSLCRPVPVHDPCGSPGNAEQLEFDRSHLRCCVSV